MMIIVQFYQYIVFGILKQKIQREKGEKRIPYSSRECIDLCYA